MLNPGERSTCAMPRTGMTPVLRGVRLVKTYGDGDSRRVVLHECSLELYPGQLVLLMGPSGSGKSTLLAVLSGLLEPDAGQVLVDDEGQFRDLCQMNAAERENYRRRHTGFIFQGYNLLPALTARQQLEVVLHWCGDRYDVRRRVDELLERLGLLKLQGKKPAQLSGGEKQRIAIARALVKNPNFVFADEPTSALDWENGQRVMELLQAAAHDRRAAVLVVSHDHRLLPYVDVYYHLEDGYLEERGLPA
jgi:putative ABC transport system ATP-binding protein